MTVFWKEKSPALRRWLEGSVVSHCCFHRTSANFEEFDCTRSDLGAHFGGLELVNSLPRFDSLVEGDRIIPVWLRLLKPLRLKDEGSFHADGIALQLAAKGMLDAREARAIHKACDRDFRQRKHHDAALRELILNAGFDSVVYESTWDRVPGRCYIALAPEQIVFALTSVDMEVEQPRSRPVLRP